jgi:23S rRNA pseudouridine1911/1915/1917 synthase
VARPSVIELGDGRERSRIPILYEDRSVLAIDKPAGWMLVPFNWQSTQRNLPAAVTSSIRAGDFWARSRNLKFLRNVHRLDAETTGILLWVKSLGGVRPYSELFKSRRMKKIYLAIVHGTPKAGTWTCRDPLARDPKSIGRMRVDPKTGQEAETRFRAICTHRSMTLVEATPVTGRTHQIRVHLHRAGCPVVGDELYARTATGSRQDQPFPMGLRAVALRYHDPFLRRPVDITAPAHTFLRSFGFPPTAWTPSDG